MLESKEQVLIAPFTEDYISEVKTSVQSGTDFSVIDMTSVSGVICS